MTSRVRATGRVRETRPESRAATGVFPELDGWWVTDRALGAVVAPGAGSDA